MVREKLKLEIIVELKIDKLEELEIEKLDKPQLYKLESELNKLERQEIKKNKII